jgi:hypothetical protein
VGNPTTCSPARQARPAKSRAIDREPLTGPERRAFEDRLLSNPKVKRSAHHVLSCLLHDYAWGGADCFPGNKAFAKRLGYSERHLQRILRDLEAEGIIRCLFDGSLGGGKPGEKFGQRRIVFLDHPHAQTVLAELSKTSVAIRRTVESARAPRGDISGALRGDIFDAPRGDMGVTRIQPFSVGEESNKKETHAGGEEISLALNGNGKESGIACQEPTPKPKPNTKPKSKRPNWNNADLTEPGLLGIIRNDPSIWPQLRQDGINVEELLAQSEPRPSDVPSEVGPELLTDPATQELEPKTHEMPVTEAAPRVGCPICRWHAEAISDPNPDHGLKEKAANHFRTCTFERRTEPTVPPAPKRDQIVRRPTQEYTGLEEITLGAIDRLGPGATREDVTKLHALFCRRFKPTDTLGKNYEAAYRGAILDVCQGVRSRDDLRHAYLQAINPTAKHPGRVFGYNWNRSLLISAASN